MNNLEEAIGICLNFYASEPEKLEAFKFIEGYKANGNWEPIWNIFSTSSDDQIRFTCLQILEGIATLQSFNHDFTILGRNLIQAFSPNQKSFITSKIVQILVIIFIDHYSKDKWSLFFHDLSTENTKLLLLKVCLGINELIGIKELQHLNRKRNSTVKEALKSRDLINLVNLWIESLYVDDNVELVLKCLTGFIVWIDASLILRQDILERIYNYLSTEKYRLNAVQFLIALISKGMPIDEKYKLVKYLNLKSMFTQFNPQFCKDNSFNVELFKLLNATGVSLLTLDFKDSQNKTEIWSFVIDVILPSAIRFCSKAIPEDTLYLCPYFVALSIHLKGRKGFPLSLEEISLLEQLFDIVIINSKIPSNSNTSIAIIFSDYEIPEDIGDSRKQMELLLEHLLHLIPQSSMAKMESYIARVLDGVSIASPIDLELVLFLLRHYGDACKDADLLFSNGIIASDPSTIASTTTAATITTITITITDSSNITKRISTRFPEIIHKLLNCTSYFKTCPLLSSSLIELCIKYSNKGLFKLFPDYRQSIFEVIFHHLKRSSDGSNTANAAATTISGGNIIDGKKDGHIKHFISLTFRMIKSCKDQIRDLSESIASISFNIAIPLKNENYLDLIEIIGLVTCQRIDLAERYLRSLLLELTLDYHSQINQSKLNIMSIGSLLKGFEDGKCTKEIANLAGNMVIQSPFITKVLVQEQERIDQMTKTIGAGMRVNIPEQGEKEKTLALNSLQRSEGRATIPTEIFQAIIYTFQRISNFVPEFIQSQLGVLFEICLFTLYGKVDMPLLTLMNNFLNSLIFKLKEKLSVILERYFTLYLQMILTNIRSMTLNIGGTDDAVQLMELEKSTIIVIISVFSSGILPSLIVNANSMNNNAFFYETVMNILEISLSSNNNENGSGNGGSSINQSALLIQKGIILLEILADHLYGNGEFNSWFKKMVSIVISIILANAIFDQNLFNEFAGLMQQLLQSSDLNIQNDFLNIAKQIGYLPLSDERIAEFMTTARMLERKMYRSFLQNFIDSWRMESFK